MLKEQVSGKVADADLAPHVTQPCAALASSKELNSARHSAARVPAEATHKAAKETPVVHKAVSPGAGPSIESVD